MMIFFDIMVVLVKIILFAFLTLLVFLLLILFVPLNYSILAQVNEEASLNFQLQWAPLNAEFYLVGLKPYAKIKVFGIPIMSGLIKRISRKKLSEKTMKSKRKIYGIQFLEEMLSLVKEILSVLKPKEMKVTGCYGLDDPANTAAASYIINLIIADIPWTLIELNPVFDSEIIDLKISISGRIVLIILLCILIKYILKEEVRKILFSRHTHNERI
ncbi:MAG: hypothetical protein AB9844_10525 [Clostridiaceae bacterium]